MARSPIPHPLAITLAVTVLSVTVSALVTQIGLAAADAPPRPIGLYLSIGIPAVAIPLIVYPLLAIINRERLLRIELERVANTDVLTGLPNRRAFFERAPRMLAAPPRRDTALTAMMIDVDNFKAINDAGGHVAGDEVLMATAEQIRRVLAGSGAEDWILARLGGDEFAALVAGLVPSAVARLADRICRETRAQQSAAGSVIPTVSVGVAFHAEGLDIDALMRLADDAVYVAKRAGRDRWAFASAPKGGDGPAAGGRVRSSPQAGAIAFG